MPLASSYLFIHTFIFKILFTYLGGADGAEEKGVQVDSVPSMEPNVGLDPKTLRT